MRDAVLAQAMRKRLGTAPDDAPGLDAVSLGEKPMLGGLFLSHHQKICAGRQGRAMDHAGRGHQAAALAIPGTAPMVHDGRRPAGWVCVNENQLSDDATRARLTARATATVRALPPKE